MIRDLHTSAAVGLVQADVVVVGAGVAGLIVASRLARRGLRVVVLESGALRQQDETHPLNATEQVGQYYKGADVGRFRCLGGTSTRWGGALVPFREEDCRFHPSGWDAAWLGVDSEFRAYLDEAEALFALPRSSYDAPDVPVLPLDGEPGFVPRLAKWPAFAKRNVAHLLEEAVEAPDGPEIWLNATVAAFAFHPDGHLASVTARSLGDRSITVSASQFVLAAGAIECTRLLLLADRAADHRIFAPHDVLGRYFHDHVADTVGTFSQRVPNGLNRISGFRFEGGGMRNLRFEPTESLRRNRDLPAAFAHISFTSSGDSPFDGLRLILRAIQRRQWPERETLRLLFGSSGWLMRAAWWRFARKRLLYPDGAQLTVDLVIEQEPRRDSRIDLSDRCDVLGLAIPRIDWRVSDADRANMLRLSELLARSWAESPLANVASLELRDVLERTENLSLSGGVYHPGGSTRLGRSANEGVVDRDLRVFGLPNVTVTSTSVFPTGGGANPTMMLVMAALRASDRVVRDLSGSR